MDRFEDCVLFSHPTGSRYICNPAPTDTDNDTILLVNGFFPWQEMLLNDGWEQCGYYEFAGRFQAFRKGEENYIVTEDEEFFKRYIHATEAAKALNLLNKDDRIKLFRAVAEAGDGIAGFHVYNPIVNAQRVDQLVFVGGNGVVRAQNWFALPVDANGHVWQVRDYNF
jgi:hypothetical protein